MAKYDDASWHYGGDYPSELPPENGATHIGMFLTWCIDTNLISEFQLEDFEEDIEKVRNREMTGTEFLFQNCDEKFTDEDLNDLGNNFTSDYYEDGSEFAKQNSSYFKDYQVGVEMLYKELGRELKSIYHLEYFWEFYEGIKIMLDQRFLQWKSYKDLS